MTYKKKEMKMKPNNLNFTNEGWNPYEDIIEYCCPDGKTIPVRKEFILVGLDDALFDDNEHDDYLLAMGIYIPLETTMFVPKEPKGYVRYKELYVDEKLINLFWRPTIDNGDDERFWTTSTDGLPPPCPISIYDVEGLLGEHVMLSENPDIDLDDDDAYCGPDVDLVCIDDDDEWLIQTCPICHKQDCHCYDDVKPLIGSAPTIRL